MKRLNLWESRRSMPLKVCTMSTVTHHSMITSYHSVSRITWVSVTKAFSSVRYNGSVLYKCWSLGRETLGVNIISTHKYPKVNFYVCQSILSRCIARYIFTGRFFGGEIQIKWSFWNINAFFFFSKVIIHCMHNNLASKYSGE